MFNIIKKIYIYIYTYVKYLMHIVFDSINEDIS